MLSFIRVKNYAVIDEVEVEFGPGLSTLTGETGAGKSILVDALGLVLGDRADASIVRPGTQQAEIAVQFDFPEGHAALEWLTERDLAADEGCLLRRVVSAEGRSRAFINNHPATLQDLRSLGALLVDIHGQQAHQSLLAAAAQRETLDAHGGHAALARDVAASYRLWQSIEAERERRHEGNAARTAELELARFQLQELTALAPEPGEFESLESERVRLANVDRLAAGLGEALAALYESDTESAHTLLVHGASLVKKLTELDPSLGDAAQLLTEAEIRLSEAATELSRYREKVDHDPERLDQVDDRLAKIRALARRHRVEPSALAGIVEPLRVRVANLGGEGDSLEALERRRDAARQQYLETAQKLSAARQQAAAALGARVTAQLGELGLPHGRFRVELMPKDGDRADAHGLEQIEFQVTLNPGQPFGGLARVASGGELSRLCLALEVAGLGAGRVPTMVFDEVDAGIGGGIAEIVGRRLAELATDRQVLCVTHLAQVASQGRRHYRVIKITDGNSTRTEVAMLSDEQRIEELSRMLGGVEITERARAHAAEMIDRAAR